jgi:hypothetical protein
VIRARLLRCCYAKAGSGQPAALKVLNSEPGGVAERLKAAVLKTAKGESPS